MQILVTGASGFLGQKVVPILLARGHRVKAGARDKDRARNLPFAEQVEWIFGDLHRMETQTLEKLAGNDLVIHLAWPGLPNYQADYHLKSTLPAEIEFLDTLVRSGLHHLLVAGTCFEYGLLEGRLKESHRAQPVVAYAKAKNLLHGALLELQKEHQFTLQWARLFYMYGPGQHRQSLFAQLDQAIENQDPVFNMSPGDQIRDFQPVECAAQSMVNLAEKSGFDGAINICSGQPASVIDLVKTHLAERGAQLKLNTGHYQYSQHEPMACWGDRSLLNQVENNQTGIRKNMKAEIKPRINTEGRTPLESVIPMDTPMVLFIDPSSSCNFKCKFCPTGDPDLIKETGRWSGQMDWDLYRKIIDDLREFPRPLKVMRLYKDGEPLLNKHFADMVRLAKESGVAETVDTTTNGFLLTPDVIGPVLDAGLDRINISVDGLSDEQFFEFTGRRVNFERFVGNIQWLYQNKGQCEICIKIAGDHLSDADKQKFFDTFGNFSDRIFIENMAPCWPEFDVEERCDVTIDRGIYDQPVGEVNTCPYIFYSLALNADGIASLCFLDWARKLVIGDVRHESLSEIWHGEALHNHRMAHLQGHRKDDEFCAECGQLSHGSPDNIDPHVQTILNNIQASRKTQK